jgi:hypothetical protein
MGKLSLIVLAGAVAVCLGMGTPAKAAVWPWCADLGGDPSGGGTNCGFASWQQCQTYLSGIGGWCYPNPYYTSEPGPRRRRR